MEPALLQAADDFLAATHKTLCALSSCQWKRWCIQTVLLIQLGHNRKFIGTVTEEADVWPRPKHLCCSSVQNGTISLTKQWVTLSIRKLPSLLSCWYAYTASHWKASETPNCQFWLPALQRRMCLHSYRCQVHRWDLKLDIFPCETHTFVQQIWHPASSKLASWIFSAGSNPECDQI